MIFTSGLEETFTYIKSVPSFVTGTAYDIQD